jgi:glucuronoarabinoxylan endo-1,4-beta-xylanase
MKRARHLIAFFVASGTALSVGCQPDAGPSSDSQTNWLVTCQGDSECGTLSCVCGVCTLPCSADDACGDAPGSVCFEAGAPGTVALCDGAPPAVAGLCLPSCDSASCAPGQQCVAGACEPVAAPGAKVTVDVSTRYQRLTGFGAAIGYAEDAIGALSDPSALYTAMFSDLGLDVLRLRNRYGEVSDVELAGATEIVNAASASLGRAPLVLLTSWSPPPALKQNGATFCATGPETCTLVRTPDGRFDYAGLATYWRSTLDAYANAGLFPDYIGIQNNPDWAPAAGFSAEACKFLPSEGPDYPGYDQALDSVIGALADLPRTPRILAPELVGTSGTEQYLRSLDLSRIHAIAHHLYGTRPGDGAAGMSELFELATSASLPLFQTEMQADGFDTARLIHQSVASQGAAMYLQLALIGPRTGPHTNPLALIGVEGDEFVLQDPYFAMRHYARFTDPDWQRVEVSSSTPGLLASAWLSPDERSLSLVLINSGSLPLVVASDVGAGLRAQRAVRTVFGGVERFTELGTPVTGAGISLPPRAMATITFEQ